MKYFALPGCVEESPLTYAMTPPLINAVLEGCRLNVSSALATGGMRSLQRFLSSERGKEEFRDLQVAVATLSSYATNNLEYYLQLAKLISKIRKRPGCTEQEVFVMAVKSQLVDIVKILLKRSVDANTIVDQKEKLCALSYAVMWGNLMMCRILVRFGADPNYKDISGKAPLNLALEEQESEIISFLLNIPGITLIDLDNSGESLILKAALYHPPSIRALLERGADPMSMDSYGNTAIHYLCEHHINHTNALETLIAAGCPFDSENRDGNTPLMLASYDDANIDMVRILVKSGTKNIGMSRVIANNNKAMKLSSFFALFN